MGGEGGGFGIVCV